MKNISLKLLVLLTLMLGFIPLARADIKVTTKQSVGGQTFESTIYIKGKRERREQRLPGLNVQTATVTQCDLRRTLQLNDAARKYIITPFDEEGMPAPSAAMGSLPTNAPASDARPGGVITYTSKVIDTGERKQLFGLTARRIKTSLVSESSPDACDHERQRIETDGWYIDLDFSLNCGNDKPYIPPSRSRAGGCRDHIRFKQIGAAHLGYPLALVTTIYDENDKPTSTFTQEVVTLSKETLDPALFDAPANYTEAKSAQELYGFGSADALAATAPSGESSADEGAASNAAAKRGTHTGETASAAATPKRPGSVRVGVIRIGNQTEQTFSTDSLREHLISSLSTSGLDAVPISAQSREKVLAEAVEKQCDFVLYTDVASVKEPGAAAKVGGGLLGRAGLGGLGKATPAYEASLSFRLLAVPASGGVAAPRLESTAGGKSDNSESAVTSALDKEVKAVSSAAKKH